MGKETLDTNTFGKSTGHNGNYSTNYQITGRELMTPDEVRMLDNRYALLFIRGERPVQDFKFDIMRHPNVALSADGNGKPFDHGTTLKDVATLTLIEKSILKPKAEETANTPMPEGEKKKITKRKKSEPEFELFSEEDLEIKFNDKENNQNENTQKSIIQEEQPKTTATPVARWRKTGI